MNNSTPEKSIDISVPFIPADKKRNHAGDLGERCSNCSGIGYTTSLAGGSLPCRDCFQTGVKAPDVYLMNKQLLTLIKEVGELKKLHGTTRTK